MSGSMLKCQTLALALLLVLLIDIGQPIAVMAAAITAAGAAESLRSALVQAQLALATDPAGSASLLAAAEATYQATLAPGLDAFDPASAERVQAGFALLHQSQASGDEVAFAAARAQIWTALLAGSYHAVEVAVAAGDPATAQSWLPLREFRTQTRFSRANADATLGVMGLRNGTLAPAEALVAVRADLLDTYQARLQETLRDLEAADGHNFPARRAELAALAEGYFAILAPAYAGQRGGEALLAAQATLRELRAAAVAGADLTAARAGVEVALAGFRAAPLSPAERTRRAGQLLRYLGLVPVEYARGVSDGRVTRPLEIQEATTFFEGAQAAFADLYDLLAAIDPTGINEVAAMLKEIGVQVHHAGTGEAVAEPSIVKARTEQAVARLQAIIPADWQMGGGASDFDVIGAMLDQMENAVRAGEYGLAESARLEAYAVLETGPEARLMVFAPQIKQQLEDLFWNGQGAAKGLAYLLKQGAGLGEIQATRTVLDSQLQAAQTLLATASAPLAVLANAALIVFREGLEAVVILASLMGSMKLSDSRHYRKPLWWGTGLAFVATVCTWLLARGVLAALARYGEKLEAIVSLIAVGVLLLITNWFFHKVYWTDWLANFHAAKRRLLSGEAGLVAGLLALGFTSVYREGFETVLFLQALVLEAGVGTVLAGAASGLAATILVGVITFKIQARLPYKKMLVVTGVLIGAVLLIMVGNTAHVLQVIGWLPIHLIAGVTLPIWAGTWLGLYPVWEGIALQAAAAVFVIGSYFLAERQRSQARERSHRLSPNHSERWTLPNFGKEV